jgi:hypothetical protein
MADEEIRKRAKKRSYKDGRKVPRKNMINGVLVNHQKGIPRPQRSPEEQITLTTKICALYSTGKYTLDACCKQFHLSRNAFNRWCTPAKDLAALLIAGQPLPKGANYECHLIYKESKLSSNANYSELLRDKARLGLVKKVEGHEIETVDEKWVVDTVLTLDEGTINERPNPNFGKMKLVERKVKTSQAAPDTAAIVFALTNTDADNFKDRKYAHIDTNTNMGKDDLEKLSDEELQRKKRKLQMQLDQETEDIDYELLKIDDED